jgi:hypothetical protein
LEVEYQGGTEGNSWAAGQLAAAAAATHRLYLKVAYVLLAAGGAALGEAVAVQLGQLRPGHAAAQVEAVDVLAADVPQLAGLHERQQRLRGGRAAAGLARRPARLAVLQPKRAGHPSPGA